MRLAYILSVFHRIICIASITFSGRTALTLVPRYRFANVANADARRLATASLPLRYRFATATANANAALTGDARSPLASPLGRRLANAALTQSPLSGNPPAFSVSP
ncbi:MAG: hypothetical protein PUP91_31105 [Rhizonema sp. PD37]|nr:hypothetical protein [Rhizonema sp. PD37]